MTHSKGDSLEMSKSEDWLSYRACKTPRLALIAHIFVLRGFVSTISSQVSNYPSLLRVNYWVLEILMTINEYVDLVMVSISLCLINNTQMHPVSMLLLSSFCDWHMALLRIGEGLRSRIFPQTSSLSYTLKNLISGSVNMMKKANYLNSLIGLSSVLN